jgi:hypothetical protein
MVMETTVAHQRRDRMTAKRRGGDVGVNSATIHATIAILMQLSRRSSVRRTCAALVAAAAMVVPADGAGPPAAEARVARYYAIGDSVMIFATDSLRRRLPGIVVDTEVARQVDDGIRILRRKRRLGTINKHTVFALGTNGAFTAGQLDRIIWLTRGRRLYVVTSVCPYCDWIAANNRMIKRRCRPERHCWVVPFAARARNHPEWFAPDGVHMPPDGAGVRSYARLVRRTIIASYG